MENEDIIESEREQMRRLLALQKVAKGILRKWSWLLMAVFVALTAFFSIYVVYRFAKSGHRFDAVTRLLYNPRQVSRIENMTDKQLLSILDRGSLKRRVGKMVEMPLDERESLVVDLSVVQERKPTNLFTLTAHSKSWVGAVKKVNTYAEVLVAEYLEYRKRNLDNWQESISARKQNLADQISEVESEETIAKGQTGVASPIEALTTLNALISDQRRNLSLINVQRTNEEVKRKKLVASVGDMGDLVAANASLIRQKSAEIAALDAEIAKLRTIYTDLNPKVKGKLDDRKAMMDSYRDLLREKGLDGVSLENVERAEQSASELAEVTLKLEVLAESHRSLEQELRENERRSSALTAVIPTLERLRIKREDLERNMRELEDQMDDIAYLQSSMGNDLQQIERAGGAGDNNPLRFKNFVLSIGGAAICTGTLMVWILFLELMFGKAVGAAELGANGDVAVIGSLPVPGALAESEEKDVLGVVALNYCNEESAKGVVLVCRLEGASEQPKFREALDWSLTMSGQRAFSLEVVQSQGFEPPPDAESMIGAVRKGVHGWFPVVNRYSFAPTELQMLQADIASLRGEFDMVFMFMPDGFRRGGNFFDQLLGVCDCAIVMVGTNATPRTLISYVRRRAAAASKPLIGLVTGASVRTVKKEMNKEQAS